MIPAERTFFGIIKVGIPGTSESLSKYRRGLEILEGTGDEHASGFVFLYKA